MTPRDALCPVAVEFVSLGDVRDAVAEGLPGAKVVLVASRGTVARLGLEAAVERLGAASELAWLDGSYANPTQVDVAAALAIIGTAKPERILCIGGGSAIDLGKAVSALWQLAGSSVAEVAEAIASKSYVSTLRPVEIVAVPTTAGTGSEFTRWATVWDVDGQAKYSIDDARLYPARALVCAEATMTMPPRLTLATGLDALSHAMEAFWARATDPLVQALALDAVRHIHANLGAALAGPESLPAREGMVLGSALAGVAFSNTRTTASHSISYPLTMRHGVDHGFAAALTLAEVARANAAAVPRIADLLAPFEADGGFDAWLDALCDGVQPLRLSAFGVGEADIPGIAELSFTAGRMDNNPVEITPVQVEAMLRARL